MSEYNLTDNQSINDYNIDKFIKKTTNIKQAPKMVKYKSASK